MKHFPHLQQNTNTYWPKEVVQHTPSLPADRLVSITQYHPDSGDKIGPPLAVGRMALPSNEIREDGKKGKAVYVLHTWKDCLWELGSGGDVPEPREVVEVHQKDKNDGEEVGHEADGASPEEEPKITAPAMDKAPPETSGLTLSPQGKPTKKLSTLYLFYTT